MKEKSKLEIAVYTMQISKPLQYSVYWADSPNDFYKRSDYKDLLPSRPRVIDPANPANNVWESGFIPPGQSAIFVSRIHSIDLSIPILKPMQTAEPL